jgi:hypothetical protein
MKRIRLISIILLIATALVACKNDLSVSPHNGQTFQEAVSTVNGLKTATIGTYGLLVPIVDPYWRPYSSFILDMGTAPSDNVTQGVTTDDAIQYDYDYNRSNTDGILAPYWKHSYKIIYSANQNIVAADKMIESSDITSNDKATLQQLKGENMFLRAKTYFDLVRTFGRPYVQNPDKNLGVPIVTKPNTNAKPERATVDSVYIQIVNDLEGAASLMTEPKNSSYASKTAAEALLSRVFLYMGKNQKVVTYADKVINSGRYKLLSTQDYPDLFSMGNINNSEDIFAIHFDKTQNFGGNSYSALFYQSPSGSGWGQWFASQPLVDLLNIHQNDIRKAFIDPQYKINSKGDTTGFEKLNGIRKYYITKFTGQYGNPQLASMVYIRYAEIFLNRAEAYAKLDMKSKAIADINKIRKRAGLRDSAMYNANNMTQQEVLNAVLGERRLEFYEEGQRTFDLYRNNRALKRDYPSVVESDGHLNMQPNDYRIIWPIPKEAINRNPNLEQNPGYGGR